MDVGGGLSLVQTVFEKLGSPIWMKIQSMLDLESQLDKLKDTLSTIEAVLLDAEEQEQQQKYRLSHVERNKFRRLKEALYRVDDLFDEIATLAHRKQLMPCSNKVCNEVFLFFSSSNQLLSAFKWSREIEDIQEMLDDIVKDHRYGGSGHPVDLEKQVMVNVRETHSFAGDEAIIGREDDKRKVIDMLFVPSTDKDVSVISIVGIGGQGKTSLAQLVYNDGVIQREFPLRMWVCVPDDFNVKALLGKILAAATNRADYSGLDLDQLQRNFRQELGGKKYLLVLDDIWNEDSNEWLKLRNLLIQGGKGSRIIVTTRSIGVATAAGSQQVHELKGLSPDESWNLFEKMTLKQKSQMGKQLVAIGEEILKKCANNPLAIRVVGSLLRGQDESRWQRLKDTDLADIKQDENPRILPVLKISYYDLPFHLKSCFTYCAIIPKDYKIIKENLIHLWMAQGFVMALRKQSLEDVGEEYFMGLLQRCFFQDVERAESGEIISCKMHDLIHDLATEVAGTEIVSYNNDSRCFNEKTRHIYIDISDNSEFSDFTKMKRMRTLLSRYWSPSPDVLSKLRYLRVLGLVVAELTTMPRVIGELLHLRYVDLSYNENLSVLSNSITKLYNLQTLKLRGCVDLKSLPRGLSKLVNLRHLDIQGCTGLTHMPRGLSKLVNLRHLDIQYCTGLTHMPRGLSKLVNLRHLDIQGCTGLTHMPPGMNNMTSLHKLTGFVLSGRGNDRKGGSDSVGEIQDLNSFTNHSDTMVIYVKKGARYDAVQAMEGSFLFKSQHLREITYQWPFTIDEVERDSAEALLQGLQPNSNLRKLNLENYPGVMFPRWGESSMNFQSYLPNLVEIKLVNCEHLEHLPLMSQLRHLKSLIIRKCWELEYVESSEVSGEGASTASTSSSQVGPDHDFVFFPSLQWIYLGELPKLKGWWKASSEAGQCETPQTGFQSNYSYTFHHLSLLQIYGCPNLTSFPLCPKVEDLDLYGFNEALWPIMRESKDGLCNSINEDSPSTSASNNRQQKQGQLCNLRTISIDDVGYLNSLPIESFQHLSHLEITGGKMERMTIGKVGEVFRSGRLSSLCSLDISYCSELKSISGRGVWEHFTALETLRLGYLRNLDLEEDEEEVKNNNVSGCTAEGDKEEGQRYPITPWRYLAPTLRTLELVHLRKLVMLPKGMHHLTALHSLSIQNCKNLEALPPWIGCLSSLQSLQIIHCDRIKSLPIEVGNLTSLRVFEIINCCLELKRRCEEQTGADWAHIKHIPHISIK